MKVTLYEHTMTPVEVELPECCPGCGNPELELLAKGMSGPSTFIVNKTQLSLGFGLQADIGGTDYHNCSDFPVKLLCDRCGVAVVSAELAPLQRMGIDQQRFDQLVHEEALRILAQREEGK